MKHLGLIIFNLFFLSAFTCKLFSQNVINKNGYNKFFYENGKISSEGYMKDNKPDGYWKNYYENGKPKIEGNRKNFLLDSTWKFYDQKGRVTKLINYKIGKKNGLVIVYDTLQKPTSIETYVNDIKQGLLRTFYKNGKTKSVVPYDKGKQEGTGYEYSVDSVITAVIVYQGGILQSYERINRKDDNNKKQGIWKEFYENLEVKKEMKFNDDSLDGYVMDYDKKGNLLSTKKFNNGKQILRSPEINPVEVYREVFQDGTLKYEGVFSDGMPIGTHYKYKQKQQCDSSYFLIDDSITKGQITKSIFVCRNVPIPDSCIEYFDGILVARGAVDSARNRIGFWKEFHHTGEFIGKGTFLQTKILLVICPLVIESSIKK